MSWVGIEEFFTPITRGFSLIFLNKGTVNVVPANCGILYIIKSVFGAAELIWFQYSAIESSGNLKYIGGIEAMASTPKLSACLANVILSLILLHATWEITTIRPLASSITVSKIFFLSSTVW